MYVPPGISVKYPHYSERNHARRVDKYDGWANRFVPCFHDDDSERNTAAKRRFRESQLGKRYIFFVGGHSLMKNSGVLGDDEFPLITPVVSTIFFSQLGEVAVSSVSKHTSFRIFADKVKNVVNGKSDKNLLPGDILHILETEDIQQNEGCPLVINEPTDHIENLTTYGAGTYQPDDVGRLKDGTIVMRNPCCFYVLDTVQGTWRELAPTYFKNNIVGDNAIPVTRPTGESGVHKYYTIVPPYTFTNPDESERPVELSDIYDAIRAFITQYRISPDECLLLFLGCRARSCGIGRVRSSGASGGKTHKRRHRNITRPRSRRRQMRRHARTKRK